MRVVGTLTRSCARLCADRNSFSSSSYEFELKWSGFSSSLDLNELVRAEPHVRPIESGLIICSSKQYS